MLVLAAIALVRALSLPVGFTVDPESAVPIVTLGNGGTVAAVAHAVDRTYRIRALRFGRTGDAGVFSPLDVLTAPGAGSEPRDAENSIPILPTDIVNAGGAWLVTASVNWSGAYSGTSFEVQRWGRTSAARWPLPACVDSGDSVDQHAYGGDADGRVALTIDRTGAGSFQVMQDENGQFAPYAFVLRGSHCRNLGRGIVQAVRGQWAAGYRNYLDGKLAPDNLNTTIQNTVAARWYGSHLRELGTGDALAIASNGFTVGADAIPGQTGCMTTNFYTADHSGKTYCPGVPHAVAWDRAGRKILLAPHAPRSVAYAVADDGTVVGMLTGAKGRHYAFRWRNGRVQRLDDLAHPPGWRFESAYAIGADGTIAGIGTLDGVATLFVWSERR